MLCTPVAKFAGVKACIHVSCCGNVSGDVSRMPGYLMGMACYEFTVRKYHSGWLCYH